MKTTVKTIPTNEIPLPFPYGAVELKAFIRKNTMRGILLTISLLIALFSALILGSVAKTDKPISYSSGTTLITIYELPPVAPDIPTAINKIPGTASLGIGPSEIAGNPKPVSDALIADDAPNFATVDVISRAGSKPGDGADDGLMSSSIPERSASLVVDMPKKEIIVEPEDLPFIEKIPSFDLARLQSLVVYSEIARRAGAEGIVYVRVLIDKTGMPIETDIEFSENLLLNKSAEEAIRKYGAFTPAIQNGVPVACRMIIPIKFKLR